MPASVWSANQTGRITGGPLPTPNYSFVTTTAGTNFVTTNGGASRVQLRTS